MMKKWAEVIRKKEQKELEGNITCIALMFHEIQVEFIKDKHALLK